MALRLRPLSILANVSLAVVLVGVYSAAVADDAKSNGKNTADNTLSARPLPGRIYDGWMRHPRAGGTRWEMVSVDPNTGDFRVEADVSLVYYLRISSSTSMAAYFGHWPGDQTGHRDGLVCCPLDGSSKQVGILPRSGAGLAWAPDGKRLLVTTAEYRVVNEQEETVLRTHAWLVNADGSGKQRLPLPDTHRIVDWSPDGKLLLTTLPLRTQPRSAYPKFRGRLYLMNADCSGVRQVTPENEQCEYGRFSPDSTRIAYLSIDSGTDGGLRVMSTADMDRNEIVRSIATGFPGCMCWSPDGKCLALEIRRRHVDSRGRVSYSGEICIEIYDLAGKKIRTVDNPKGGTFWGTDSLDWR